MIRTLSIATAAAAALAALPIAASASPAAYYVATPLAAPAKLTVLTGAMIWTWSGTAFVARQGSSRDAITCQMIARSVGKLASFTAADQPFDADALAKCNARAR